MLFRSVPPEGPDWSEFSIRVAESDIDEIPHILSRREHEAEEMGRRARATWENWFCEAAVFHRMTNWCLDMKQTRRLPVTLLQLSNLPQLLTPRYAKAWIQILKGHLKQETSCLQIWSKTA